MKPVKMSRDIKEARFMIAEISDWLEKLIEWAGNEADSTINGLHEKWQELMAKTDAPISAEFVGKCEKLLDECETFHTTAGEKILKFVDDTKEKIPTIKESAGDNEETMSTLKDVLDLWNETVLSRLKLFCDNTEQLTLIIMDNLKFIVEPIETVTEISE